ncbi:MAG: hypothetical protein U5K75_00280 [Ahrensia sp.]|nr:hypothetical protein [Ahrensia sp.]
MRVRDWLRALQANNRKTIEFFILPLFYVHLLAISWHKQNLASLISCHLRLGTGLDIAHQLLSEPLRGHRLRHT